MDGNGLFDSMSFQPFGPLLSLAATGSLTLTCSDSLSRGLSAFPLARMSVFADVNNDSRVDAVVLSSTGSLAILLNNGTGYFTDVSVAVGVSTLANGYGVCVADIDGDGDVDVLFAASQSSTRLLLNNGTGVFADVTTARLGSIDLELFSFTAFDVNNDSAVDLFATSSSGRVNRLYINNGTGYFTDQAVSRGVSANVIGSVIRGTTVGDVNNDGALDMFVTSSTANRLYMNNGTGWFTNNAVASNVVLNASAYGAFFVDYDQGIGCRECATEGWNSKL